MEFKWSDFGKIDNKNSLEQYLKGREYRHGYYCHYTSLEIIDKILEGKSFHLSSVKGFNDCNDIKNFKGREKLCYTLCFSTGINENLALWYLYSGIDGQGGRIRFTKKWITELIKNGQFALYKFDKPSGKRKEKVLDLVDQENMCLSFRDVLYFRRREDQEKVDLKYNTMTNYKIEFKDFDKYLDNNKEFCKGLIWYYEKETRLLVELINKAAELASQEDDFVVLLTIPDSVYENMQIDCGPEILDYSSVICKYKTISDYMFRTSNLNLSAHKDEVKMNLCKKCHYKELKSSE